MQAGDGSLLPLQGAVLAEAVRSASVAESGASSMRASIEQLRAILELSEVGILYVTAGGDITQINGTLCRMLGIDLDYVAGGVTLSAFERHLGEMLAQEESARQPVSDLREELARTAGRPGRSVSRTIRLASPRFVILSTVASVTASGDHVIYFRDTTREAEVDRIKTEFLSTAAHELRTPLASIFGFTELMLARKLSEVQQKDVLDTVHRQAKLLINLINELLDLSRIESRQGKDFHRQFHRISTIVDHTIRGLLVKGDRRQVLVHMPHGAECIMVDTEKTQQALLNVLSNAFKYSPDGGEIRLETQLKEERDARYVGIRVTDCGIGMSADQVKHVFERFWRADVSGQIPGTGLGMSLVKEITELQEGHVLVESRLGAGTSVTLWFPLIADFVLSRPSDLL